MAEKDIDYSYISRLQEEQRRVYVDCQERLHTWEKFKSDYEALENRLSRLPDKVTHEVMVPFGSLAFMPGKLVHTNEIMVLLGDNWFVERSAKQALEIVGRRKQQVEKNIDGIKADIEGFESRMNFTSYFEKEAKNSGYFEIKEELTKEEEEKLKSHGRKAHPKAASVGVKRVTGLRQSDRKSTSSRSNKFADDVDLFARLDELEAREKENKEFERDNIDENLKVSSVTKDGRIQKQGSEKKQFSQTDDLRSMHTAVQWADGAEGRAKVCNSDSDDDDDDGDNARSNIIQVTFTEQKIPKESKTKLTNEIHSPGDIYKTFEAASKPQSILKPSDVNTKPPVEGTSDLEKLPDALKQHQSSDGLQFQLTKAFSGQIVERNASVTESTKSSSRPQEAKVEEKRKVSKFKAGRKNTK